MILNAVIEGLEMLKKSFNVIVYSQTLFGISNIYENGVLRENVPAKSSNYELKEKIWKIVGDMGHRLVNAVDKDVKSKLLQEEVN